MTDKSNTQTADETRRIDLPAGGVVEPVALIAPDAVWLVHYDDAERRPDILLCEKTARRYFKSISDQWNAHLFVKVESNSRDDQFYSRNAVLATPQPSEKYEVFIQEIALGVYTAEEAQVRAKTLLKE